MSEMHTASAWRDEGPSRPLGNPYVGLRPFQPHDQDRFFGRDQHVNEILEHLKRDRFLAVVGTSGCGKSSLVHAGLIPRLERTFTVRRRGFWRIVEFRPGSDPVRNLARALCGMDEGLGDTGSIVSALPEVEVALGRAELMRDVFGLRHWVERAELDPHENLLVVVDQFEELFRYRQLGPDIQRDEAAHFVSLLLEAAADPDVPIFVLLTLRADFLGDCSLLPGLAAAINRGQYLVPMLDRRQREDAIVGPLAARGHELEPKLLHQLQHEIRDVPDQLPVLQHALMRTWAQYELGVPGDGESRVSERHYQQAGGFARAMSDDANEALGELSSHRLEAVAERMFRCLTERGEHGRAVRRPCRVQELRQSAGASLSEVAQVIATFRHRGRHFLVVQPPGPVADASEVDLAHESLMRVWDRLADWTQRELEDASLLSRLLRSAEIHAEDPQAVLHEPELSTALNWKEETRPTVRWAARYGADWKLVDRFLVVSEAARDAAERRAKDAAEAERRRAQERLARQKAINKTLRNRLMAVIAVLVVAVIAIVYGVYANNLLNDLSVEVEKANAEVRTARAQAAEVRQSAELKAVFTQWKATGKALVAGREAAQAREEAASFREEAASSREELLHAKEEAIRAKEESARETRKANEEWTRVATQAAQQGTRTQTMIEDAEGKAEQAEKTLKKLNKRIASLRSEQELREMQPGFLAPLPSVPTSTGSRPLPEAP